MRIPAAAVFLSTVLAASGCETGIWWQYQADCITVLSELELRPDVVDNNVRIAKELLEPVVGNFCKEFQGLTVEVYPQQSWVSNGTTVCGTYDIFRDVRVNREMFCMVHEMFHVLDAHQMVLNSYWHVDWETNGREELDGQYNARIDRNVVK